MLTSKLTAVRFALASILGAALLACASCGELVERATPKAQLDKLNATNFTLDVDPIMRGTVASETVVTGFSPTKVHGYGLVVGLNGTGSRIMPAEVRAHMLQEMARKFVGYQDADPNAVSPERMLESEDVAVVIVEGVIPSGAPKGTGFDVRVSIVPGSGTSSLEGGNLWTCDLRPGPLVTGNRQGRVLAEAKGDIFINPFVEPQAAAKRDTINRTSGRILDGGRVKDDMLLRLRLATTSHSRAETIQGAINSMYPREPGQKDQTARGRTGDAIDVTVPPSFHERPEDFVQLVQHTPLMVEAPEQTSMYVRRALLAAPGMAEAASWRWRAIGKKALPMIQDLYSYPEEEVRMAALVAGAHLDDPMTIEPLLDMAKSGQQKNRLTAIALLSPMGVNPRIDVGLRPFLDDTDVDIRLGAFEALEERRDPLILRGTVDDKFDLLVVPSTRPMVYITQMGRPKVVVFGEGIEVERPISFAAWSNRLMVRADDTDAELQIRWRASDSVPSETKWAPPNVAKLVAFLGHLTTIERPQQGLGLTYAETIGALHLLWKSGDIKADFKAEQDRILAAIIRSQKPDEIIERPEFDDPAEVAKADEAEPKSSDLAAIAPSLKDAPVSGAKGATSIERAGLQRDTVPR